jgi:hypothetical protein
VRSQKLKTFSKDLLLNGRKFDENARKSQKWAKFTENGNKGLDISQKGHFWP